MANHQIHTLEGIEALKSLEQRALGEAMITE